MINSFVGMGRICNDLELKTTPTGKYVISFTIAIDRDFINENGEKETDFISVVAWNHTAKFVSQYFRKGSLILIQGSVRVRSYTTYDNQKRYVTEIIANHAYFTGEKTNTQAIPVNNANTGIPNTFQNQTPNFEEFNDDDLPF